jgi:uncharacterized protein (DUF1015 family)
MVRLHPFPALRPTPSVAARVASVPYDVVNREEAAALADGNPSSFLRVIRSEIDLPAKTDPYDPAVYTRAGENLRALQDDGTLVREASPMLYLYRLVMNGRSQLGIVGCCHLDDYADNVIRKHERTRPDKEDDRTRHILSLEAQTGLVLLTFRDLEAFEKQALHDVNSRPLFHFNATDGITHTVWQVPETDVYREMFATLDCAYVADGHHRIASAARAAAESTGTEKDWFLAALFPAGALTILPYNRLITDLAGLTPDQLLGRLGEVGTVTPSETSPETRPGVFGLFVDGHWHRLELDPRSINRDDAVRSLDVSLLQDRVLEPILGIADQRSDRRIEFIGGIRGSIELERRVNASPGAVAFSLHATSADQLLTVADAGLFMPPKSTWFEPKLRSGLFVHTL